MTEHQPKSTPQIAGIVKLSKLTRGSSDLAGAKAANLGELAVAGFPVPDGFVILPLSQII